MPTLVRSLVSGPGGAEQRRFGEPAGDVRALDRFELTGGARLGGVQGQQQAGEND